MNYVNNFEENIYLQRIDTKECFIILIYVLKIGNSSVFSSFFFPFIVSYFGRERQEFTKGI